MDPEQIYQEVLSEEQGKGSPSAIAEGRAKAARQRARHGSPHPKEPRWWPGSQPQFEGGEAAPAAEAEPEPEAEEPAAEEPAAAPPDIGDAAQSERPDAPAPAPAAGTETTAPAPAEVPAAAAVATAPAAAAEPAAQARPAGVTHGTDSGNRLRPEDSVGTDAQFDAQKALAERRRLIDELVATGVPAATAQHSGQSKAPLLLLAYILIPLMAILLLQQSAGDEAEAGGEPAPVEAAGPTTAVAAEGSKFDVETITLAAAEPASIDFENKDTVQHNIAIYEDDSASGEIFKGDLIDGGDTTTYEFDAPEAGEYYFRCDVHPDMDGNVVSE